MTCAQRKMENLAPDVAPGDAAQIDGSPSGAIIVDGRPMAYWLPPSVTLAVGQADDDLPIMEDEDREPPAEDIDEVA